MARVVLTNPAEADVAEIAVYLTENAGLQVAERYLREFDAAYDRLEKFPATGSPRPAFGRNTRVVLVDPYVIFYDYLDDIVTIVRVLHGRRDITPELVRETER
jgi:toxin ParE1/3/4